MYDDRTNLSQQVNENLKAFFDDKLLKTTIPRNIRLAEAPSHGKPVSLYDPKSRGAEAYRELALELLSRNNIASPEEKRRKAAAAAAASSLKSFNRPEKKAVSGNPAKVTEVSRPTAETEAFRSPKTGIHATKWPLHAQWARPAGQKPLKSKQRELKRCHQPSPIPKRRALGKGLESLLPSRPAPAPAPRHYASPNQPVSP